MVDSGRHSCERLQLFEGIGGLCRYVSPGSLQAILSISPMVSGLPLLRTWRLALIISNGHKLCLYANSIRSSLTGGSVRMVLAYLVSSAGSPIRFTRSSTCQPLLFSLPSADVSWVSSSSSRGHKATADTDLPAASDFLVRILWRASFEGPND